MVSKFLLKEEKAHILALREENVPVNEICVCLRWSKATIMKLFLLMKGHPVAYIPCHKQMMGNPKKTSQATNKLLIREIANDPSISSTELKRLYPEVLKMSCY